ncbi:hypothetical protein [Yoonia maricola]|nr:hypothetical protein [Yoonia maricola]
MEYSTWFEPGEDLFGKTYDGRIIPTNMAIWVETQPGVFIADGSPALHPSEAAIVNEARVMVTDAAPQKREGSLWCMLWNSEHRMHGLVCTE